MIVQCPHCSARYKVNDANIPASGGRIKCPSCQSSFVVYPEAAQPAPAPAPAPSPVMGGYDEDKTSVASIPDLQMLRNQAAAQQRVAHEEEEASATEVISGDSIPNFASLFGGAKADPRANDGTVEIQNPMSFASAWQHEPEPTIAEDEEEAGATEVISADMVFNAQAFGRQGAVRREEPAPQPMAQPIISPQLSQPKPFASPAPVAAPAKPLTASLFDDMTNEQPLPLDLGFGSPVAPAPQPSLSGSGPQPGPVADGVDPNHNGPWKLKTNFGLTYEFADTKSLQSWMASRDELDGYTLSADDATFLPLASFPQVMSRGGRRSGASAAMRAAPPTDPTPPPGYNPPPQHGFPNHPAPPLPVATPAAGKEVKNNFKLESRDAGATKFLWLLIVVMTVIGVALALHISEVINLKELLGLDAPVQQAITSPTPQPVTPPKQEQPVVDIKPAEITPAQRAQVDSLIEDAQIALKSNKYLEAKEKLETAKLIDKNRFQIYDLLAQIYDKTGEKDKAEETRKHVQQLRTAALQDAEEEEQE